MQQPGGSDIVFQLMVGACILSALVTVISFLLYVRTRLADRSPEIHRREEDHSRLLQQLDEKEGRYQSIHFISLLIFVVLGVLILIRLSNRPDRAYSRRCTPRPTVISG